MQTFLPYESFEMSAQSLSDGKGGHLNNQRNEALVILKSCISPLGGWPHHSATRMWRGYEWHLVIYIEALQAECERRGIAGGTAMSRAHTISLEFHLARKRADRPLWLGDPEFHRGHRSNLIRKNPDHYGPQFPGVPDDLPYIWPKEKS